MKNAKFKIDMRKYKFTIILVMLYTVVIHAQQTTVKAADTLKIDTITGLKYLGTNKEGYKEYLHDKDSSVLIEVPRGNFMMGSNDNENEKPIHNVDLDYYIGISPYGCLDMAGNVWQWCFDQYRESYSCSSKERRITDRQIDIVGVYRGGGWRYQKYNCRCTTRGRSYSDVNSDNIGFRVAK